MQAKCAVASVPDATLQHLRMLLCLLQGSCNGRLSLENALDCCQKAQLLPDAQPGLRTQKVADLHCFQDI